MIRLKIYGMTCEHCAIKIKKALEGVEGVKKVEVFFLQGYAEIEGEAKLSELIKAVEKTGYKAEKIEEHPQIYISKGNVYDLFILGGGSAGFSAAIRASDLGAKVLIVENNVIGGTCLNRGCIPSKFLIDVAKEFYRIKKPRYGSIKNTEGEIYFKEVLAELKMLIEKMRKEKYWDVLDAYPTIDYKQEMGEFIDEKRARVGSEEITFFKAIVTTGSRPSLPSVSGIEHVKAYTSDSIFDIDHLPEHLIIIGAGAVGLEIGQAFLRMGSRVSIIEATERIGGNEEPELTKRLRELLEKEGMEILTSARIMQVKREGERVTVKLMRDGKVTEISGTDILIATGRKPNTENIGLDRVGVEIDERGFIITNEYLQTTKEKIYGAGDCVGRYMLVTVAALEGAVASENALLGNVKKIDYNSIPHAIFTDPELASVGYKEEELKNRGISYRSTMLEFSKVPRAILSRKKEGIIKMLAEEKTNKILGVHILAEEGAEIIHKAVPIVKYGLTVEDVIEMVDIYPTLSESVKLCALSFVRDISKLSCCAQ